MTNGTPGNFKEEIAKGLDYVVAESGKRGIRRGGERERERKRRVREEKEEENFSHLFSFPPHPQTPTRRLILALSSNWGDVGSLSDLVRKSGGGAGGRDPAEVFFSSPAPRKLYLRHASALANRVNSITGVRYGDDPTIFAVVSEEEGRRGW
jgi:hypothetical protein